MMAILFLTAGVVLKCKVQNKVRLQVPNMIYPAQLAKAVKLLYRGIRRQINMVMQKQVSLQFHCYPV